MSTLDAGAQLNRIDRLDPPDELGGPAHPLHRRRLHADRGGRRGRRLGLRLLVARRQHGQQQTGGRHPSQRRRHGRRSTVSMMGHVDILGRNAAADGTMHLRHLPVALAATGAPAERGFIRMHGCTRCLAGRNKLMRSRVKSASDAVNAD